MEYVDILNDLGEKTGIVKERQSAKRDKNYTLGAHVWILNSNGQLLMQQRSLTKHNFPGMWDMTGGCVQAGETSLDAIKRELQEELGVAVKDAELEYLFRFPANRNSKPMFLDIYLLVKDIELKSLQLQREEVINCGYFLLSKLEGYFENGDFVKQPYIEELLPILKEMAYANTQNSGRRSCHQLLYSNTGKKLSCH